MKLTPQQVSVLLGRLSSDRVKRRSQGSATLSYLEAWDVKASLIRVFGFAGFSAEVIESKVLRLAQDVPAMTGTGANRKPKMVDGQPVFNWQAVVQVTVRLTIPDPEGKHDAVYTEAAISAQINPDPGEAADFAIKTAESDALKRAAIYLGTQFGLSLYDDGKTVDVVKVLFAPDQVIEKKEEGPKQDPVAQAQAFIDGKGQAITGSDEAAS